MSSVRINVARRAAIGRSKRERTQAGLLQAARRVIAAKGSEACTIDDFIVAAGVARGTFYNYFKAREQVVEAVAQEVLAELKADISARLRDIGDPAERIARIVRYCTDKAGEDPEWGSLMVHMMSAGPYLGNAMHREFAADLKAGAEAGRFTFESLPAALDLVKGTTLFCMRSMARGSAEMGHVEEVVKLVLSGLGVRSTEVVRLASPVNRGNTRRATVRKQA